MSSSTLMRPEPAHHHVRLLLLAVVMADRAEAGRVAKVAHTEVLGVDVLPREARLDV